MIDQKQLRTWLTYGFVASLVAVTLLPLPQLGGSLIGHVLGIIGTLIMLLALVYTFRKRILGHKGKKNPIATHTLWGLLGPTLVIFHTGGEIQSILGNLVFMCMVVVVFSGIIGIYLFKRVRKTLKEHEQEVSQLKKIFFEKKLQVSQSDLEKYIHTQSSLDIDSDSRDVIIAPTAKSKIQELENLAEMIADIEHTTKFYATIELVFAKWLKIHIALVFFLFAFLGSHVAAMIYFGLRWL